MKIAKQINMLVALSVQAEDKRYEVSKNIKLIFLKSLIHLIFKTRCKCSQKVIKTISVQLIFVVVIINPNYTIN